MFEDGSRGVFSVEHHAFRDQVRRFVEREIAPHHASWEELHCVPRSVWATAGSNGLLCAWLEEQYGGAGGDFLFDVVVSEELNRAGATGPGFGLHSLIVAPYIAHYGTPSLKERLLPGMASGELIGAIAMTEPGAGSDLGAIRTRARRTANGWVIDGQKTFITNGHNADVIVVACKTDPEKRASGVSLFVVESTSAGFAKGRSLRKIGQQAQDTAELFFDGVEVSHEHLLGEEGRGFRYLMQELSQERLLISVQCQARAEAVLQWTIDYARQRQAFGTTLSQMQSTRFSLASLWAEVQAGRAYCDALLAQHLAGKLDAASASAGKLWHSEMLGRVVDACVQVHGGYGYMAEYPVARAFVDARIERIYGGASEIMKEVIARRILDEEATQ